MSITTTYNCDLCKEKKDAHDLFSFLYNGLGYELKENVKLCDKHICINCIQIIKVTKFPLNLNP